MKLSLEELELIKDGLKHVAEFENPLCQKLFKEIAKKKYKIQYKKAVEKLENYNISEKKECLDDLMANFLKLHNQ